MNQQQQRDARLFARGVEHGKKELQPRINELEDALQEAMIQLEYLNAKFQETGTTNAVLVRIAQVLSK